MCELPELSESIEPSIRTPTLGATASWVGAGRSDSLSFSAGSGGLVLRIDRGEAIESEAFSAITSGARLRFLLGLADPRPAKGSRIFS
ncbi:hypothetical protein A9X00_10120 [Mycobacterium sp. 1245805.9]|nr:hypothetical protein A9X00_10120 [Mycobacterium sp. 1245805.9]